MYIRDTIYVPLRGGESTEYRILHRGVRSGSALTLISSNEESGYSHVRMESGLEGWVQTQYLTNTPIAQDLLDGMRNELENLSVVHEQNLLRLAQLQTENENLEGVNQDHEATTAALTNELSEIKALAADVIGLNERNGHLVNEQTALMAEIESLSVANEALQNTSDQQWFLRGGGVVLIGLLFGFWIARRIYHRRNNSGWA